MPAGARRCASARCSRVPAQERFFEPLRKGRLRRSASRRCVLHLVCRRPRIVNPSTTGYSGTPLAKKLGIREGSVVLLFGAPDGYAALLQPLPSDVAFTVRAGPVVDIAHLFVVRKAELRELLVSLRKDLRVDAAVWVSWPKKSAKLPTDVTEGTIRDIALPLGFVDIKVCAVDAVWSGLKLVVRKELR